VNLDVDKLATLFVIAMLVLGPKRLPEATRALARGLGEFRKYRSALTGELKDFVAEPLGQISAFQKELRDATVGPRSAIEESLREGISRDAGRSVIEGGAIEGGAIEGCVVEAAAAGTAATSGVGSPATLLGPPFEAPAVSSSPVEAFPDDPSSN
jgi:Sec-independent protein translocase protein TatA